MILPTCSPLPLDIVIQRQTEDAIAAGRPLPRWGWKAPASYNGCTGAERIEGWQKVRIAEQLGLLSRGRFCSLCHTARAEQFHAENYLRPIAVKAVCRGCHFRVHRRFVDPSGWRLFLKERVRAGEWALCLQTMELTRPEIEQVALARDIFAEIKKLRATAI